jgi:putative FmdB family regulatory protein
MPVYEYKCNACGREFEVQQRMSDAELTDCEVCGKKALERLISRTAFSLKGGGWYKDLYASTKPESKSSESKSDGGSSSSSSDSSSSSAASSSSSTPSGSASGGGASGSGSSGSGSSGGTGGSSGTKAAASAS